jgi:nitrous oxidase accessory protein NosD
LYLLSPVPLAAETVLSGTVQQINAPERTLTLQFVDGNTLTLTAPPGVLNDVHPGDAVEVRTAGSLVTGLTMKGAGPQVMQPSGMSPRLGFGGPVVPRRSS